MNKKDPSWSFVAEEYSEAFTSPDSYHSAVILPNVMRVLEGREGPLLEIGCGTGFFSHALFAKDRAVIGIDVSPEMIREASRGTGPTFCVASAEALPFENAEFETVLSVLALQNMRDLQKTLTEASRVLRPRGMLVIVLNHPVLRIPKRSSWGFEDGVQYRRLDAYMTEHSAVIEMDPGKRRARHTISYHRPLQTYFKSLTKAGFAVIGLEEWISHKKSEIGPRAKAENTARKEFPLFMMMRASKVK